MKLFTEKENRIWLISILLGLLLLFSIFTSLCLGEANLGPFEILSLIMKKGFSFFDTAASVTESPESIILFQVRLPRIILALGVGAGLSVAGALYQGALRNPLAEPHLLGVTSGSALAAVLCIGFGWTSGIAGYALPVLAFLGGIISLFIVLKLASSSNNHTAEALGKLRPTTVVLAGVIVSAFIGSVLTVILSTQPEQQGQILAWLMGSLSLRGWDMSLILYPYLLIGLFFAWKLAPAFNLLALGETQALATGLDVKRIRLLSLATGALLAAACVAVAGSVGFVGLVVPHVLRLLIGPDYRRLIPLSAISGAIFVLICDAAARTIIAPGELPLGVLTSFAGAPFFAWLLRRASQGEHGHI